jgi:hypothetical protein
MTTDKSHDSSVHARRPRPVPCGALESETAHRRTAEGFEMFEMSTETGLTAAKAIVGAGLRITDTRRPTPKPDRLFSGVIIVNWRVAARSRKPRRRSRTGDDQFCNPSPGWHALAEYGDRDNLSNVIAGGTLCSTVWPPARPALNDAVTAVLLGNSVTNEYVLDAGTKSRRRGSSRCRRSISTSTCSPPAVHQRYTEVGACGPTFGVVFDREARRRS